MGVPKEAPGSRVRREREAKEAQNATEAKPPAKEAEAKQTLRRARAVRAKVVRVKEKGMVPRKVRVTPGRDGTSTAGADPLLCSCFVRFSSREQVAKAKEKEKEKEKEKVKVKATRRAERASRRWAKVARAP